MTDIGPLKWQNNLQGIYMGYCNVKRTLNRDQKNLIRTPIVQLKFIVDPNFAEKWEETSILAEEFWSEKSDPNFNEETPNWELQEPSNPGTEAIRMNHFQENHPTRISHQVSVSESLL